MDTMTTKSDWNNICENKLWMHQRNNMKRLSEYILIICEQHNKQPEFGREERMENKMGTSYYPYSFEEVILFCLWQKTAVILYMLCL